MKKIRLVLPGSIDRPTGGYGYTRHMRDALIEMGREVEIVGLRGTYPLPSGDDRRFASECLSHIPDGSSVVVDGLAFGALPDVAERHAKRLRLIALVHHPLAHETGLNEQTAAKLQQSERETLSHCHRVVTTCHSMADRLVVEYAVPRGHIFLAPPGTVSPGKAACLGDPPVILCLGSIIPRKGHDVLVEALDRVRDLAWRARIVGEDDSQWANAVRRKASHLGARIVFTGPVALPTQELLDADLFALPSRYEGYGMAYAEALSAGLPVIGCPVGVLPDILPEAAGKIVPVGDAAALAQALRTLLSSRDLRAEMSNAAYAAGKRLPSWKETAQAFATAVDGLHDAI